MGHRILKIGIWSFLGIWGLLALSEVEGGVGISHAQERGIGVTPAKIEIQENVEWPYTVPITVFNLSSAREQFEVTFEIPRTQKLSMGVEPGRFLLESEERKKIFVTFDAPQREVSGFVKVATMGGTEDFPTGTGIKIPFSVISDTQRIPFGASISAPRERFWWFPWALGTTMILVTLVLLWHIADMVRVWIVNSNKN